MEPQTPTYAQAIAELEGILAKMQSPDCDIDNLARYARVSMLSRRPSEDTSLRRFFTIIPGAKNFFSIFCAYVRIYYYLCGNVYLTRQLH